MPILFAYAYLGFLSFFVPFCHNFVCMFVICFEMWFSCFKTLFKKYISTAKDMLSELWRLNDIILIKLRCK